MTSITGSRRPDGLDKNGIACRYCLSSAGPSFVTASFLTIMCHTVLGCCW